MYSPTEANILLAIIGSIGLIATAIIYNYANHYYEKIN